MITLQGIPIFQFSFPIVINNKQVFISYPTLRISERQYLNIFKQKRYTLSFIGGVLLIRKSFQIICFDEVFETTVDQNSNLNMKVKEDNNIMQLFGKIRKIIDQSFKNIEEFTRKLLYVKQNYNTYSECN